MNNKKTIPISSTPGTSTMLLGTPIPNPLRHRQKFPIPRNNAAFPALVQTPLLRANLEPPQGLAVHVSKHAPRQITNPMQDSYIAYKCYVIVPPLYILSGFACDLFIGRLKLLAFACCVGTTSYCMENTIHGFRTICLILLTP